MYGVYFLVVKLSSLRFVLKLAQGIPVVQTVVGKHRHNVGRIAYGKTFARLVFSERVVYNVPIARHVVFQQQQSFGVLLYAVTHDQQVRRLFCRDCQVVRKCGQIHIVYFLFRLTAQDNVQLFFGVKRNARDVLRYRFHLRVFDIARDRPP